MCFAAGNQQEWRKMRQHFAIRSLDFQDRLLILSRDRLKPSERLRLEARAVGSQSSLPGPMQPY
jgi:hypothetical protein